MTLAEALRIAPGDVVALVGGGGKTTILYRLARELSRTGRRVLVTTTTKIYPPLPDQVDWAIADEDDDLRLAHVAGMLRRHAIVAALSGPGPEGKMNGVSPAWVEQAATHAGADCILVEADGAARQPIKAPAQHEPVIPTCATVVVAVIGLDALGAPLDAEHVHRPDRIAALTGLAPGEPLTAEAIALLATHAEGLAKGAPPGARLEYVLNKVDGPQEVSRARLLALALCRAGAPRVVLARAEHADPVQEVFGAEQITDPLRTARPYVGGVILAAGEAKRMGSTKQLLDVGGRPLLQHVLDSAGASSLDELVLVVGHDAEAVLEGVEAGRARVVINPLYGEGQSTSLKAGLASLRPGVHGALILLGDQPLVSADIIDRLVAAFIATDAPVVAPGVEGRRGNPVLVREDLLPLLLGVSGDRGGREVVAGFASETVLVPLDGPGVEIDVDTPEELERVRSLWVVAS